MYLVAATSVYPNICIYLFIFKPETGSMSDDRGNTNYHYKSYTLLSLLFHVTAFAFGLVMLHDISFSLQYSNTSGNTFTARTCFSKTNFM